MKGHIKLGAVGSTLRSYKLVNERSYRRVTANPYSAKISTGGGTYDDLEPFAYWVQDDWQNGIGHKNPDEGLLFSTAETRVPNQIILPQIVKQSDGRNDDGSYTDCRNIGRLAAGGVLAIGVGAAAQYRAIAIKLDPTGSTNSKMSIGIFGYHDSDAAIACYLSSSVGGAHYWDGAIWYPTGGLRSPLYRWMTTTVETTGAFTVPTYLHIVPASGVLYLPCTAAYTNAEIQTYIDPTWSVVTGNVHPIFTTNIHALTAATVPLSPTTTIVRFNNTLYAGMGAQLVKYTAATDTWATVGTARAGTIWDLAVWDSTLHVGIGSGNYYTLSTADAYTDAGVGGTHFAKWNGYLWRRYGNNIYYSADGSTWSSAIAIPDSSGAWTGMAGLGDVLYVATTDALYYVAPGDVLVGVTRWGSSRSTNGSSLTHHQGQLYAIVDGGLCQIAVSGGSASILPIWVQRDDDLIADYLERPVAIASCNNWLICLVQQTSTTLKSSIWAWTGQGWHYLAEVPINLADTLYYDFTTSNVWTGSRAGVFFNVRVPDFTLNPTNDSGSSYVPSAWFETGWITGGLKDVEKDFESVYISGDTLNASQYVEVFFKSSRTGSWTLLGTIDAPGEELRWSTYASRPATKELKLGFRLFSKSLTATPDIDVIRLKYLPNVNDRWQWTLPIEVGPGQEMIDGTLNTYTVAQMRSHLEALVQSTPPFLLEDIDGTQYEVVCTGASVDVARLDHYNNEIVPWYIYTMTLEQVRGAAYV